MRPVGRSVTGNFRVRFGCLTGWGAWTDSDMQGGPVDELLDVGVERPALEQLEVEVGRTLEDRVHSGLTGDHREERHLEVVEQLGALLTPVAAPVGAFADGAVAIEAAKDVEGVGSGHDALLEYG